MKEKILKILYYGIKAIITGFFVGLIVGTYQLCANLVIDASKELFATQNIMIALIVVVVVAALAFIAHFLVTFDTNIAGSGIPQLEVNIRKKLDNMKWYKTMPLMFINSIVSFFAGLGLGSEGPSVVLGGNASLMVNDWFKDDDEDEVAIASGAGFGCAFLSPLAGIFYTFEESLHRFNIKIIIRTIIIVFVAFFISSLINHHHLLTMDITTDLGFEEYYPLIFVILLNVIVGSLFVLLLIRLKDFLAKHKKNFFVKYRIYWMFILALLVSFFFAIGSGSGGRIIAMILEEKSILILLGLLLFRFVYTIFSANSTATGGLVVPIICFGALSGMIVCVSCNQLFGFEEQYFAPIVLISMLTSFAVVTKAPLTALAVIVSTVGFNTHGLYILLPAFLTIAIAYFLSRLTKIDCLYELLIERL